MCYLCVEINRDRISILEVGKALKEFSIPEEHELQLFETIEKKYSRKEIKEMFEELAE